MPPPGGGADEGLVTARRPLPETAAAGEKVAFGGHQPGDHGFAQARAGVQDNAIPTSCGRVGAEHHTGNPGVDHGLDNHGH